MIKQTTLKRLLSHQTVEKLDNALNKGNMEQLKKYMEKLFSFKNIFNLHDDHLIELAECIIDIAQSDDKVEYAHAIEQYARIRISSYHKRKAKLSDEYHWTLVAKSTDKIATMDSKYKLWVYEEGFKYSQYQMYKMLCNITQSIQKEV